MLLLLTSLTAIAQAPTTDVGFEGRFCDIYWDYYSTSDPCEIYPNRVILQPNNQVRSGEYSPFYGWSYHTLGTWSYDATDDSITIDDAWVWYGHMVIRNASDPARRSVSLNDGTGYTSDVVSYTLDRGWRP